MSSLPGWMPILLDRINWGCSSSPWFVDLADETKVLERARQILRDLWPFIKELPANIQAVRAKVPEPMQAARNLLSQLGDDERQYQQLFKQQFAIARLTQPEIEASPRKTATTELCKTMASICRNGTYNEGIHAIVAAELAATMYCRASLPSYEHYFEGQSASYEPGIVQDGLAWLRLHAKTHTRHAIWMKRMLCDVEDSFGNEIPQAAEFVLEAVLTLWECPQEIDSPQGFAAITAAPSEI